MCLPNPEIEKIYVPSDTRCASYCISYTSEPCHAFIWNRTDKTCMAFGGISRNVEAMTSDVEIYNVNKEGCTNKGYFYDPNSNTCLKMFADHNNKKTWKEARQHCQVNGGDLISITSKEKWDFILNFTSCMTSMWIGLKGNYWATNTTFENIYGLNVHDIQLNKFDGDYLNETEADCVRIEYTHNYVLSDFSCNIKRKDTYLCEILMP
ncbi:CD206 [Mytilus edulis]|uniref:MRC n=1 Tax=Mytilus edulis TaxID=6550 RepID=A0A8S3SSY3_MYTED|nr:CD206 [Mytilus edulis]